MASLHRLFARGERGQSLVEFSLALPVLVFGLVGGSDLARAFAVQLAIQNGARAGAEAAAVTYSGPNGVSTAARAKDEISRTPTLVPTNARIAVTFKQTDGLTDCPVTGPTVVTPCYANVEVVYTFNTVVPWPLVPNTVTFDRSTTMRIIAAPTGPSTYTCGPGYPACP